MARIPVKLREKSAPEEEAMSQTNVADATIQKKPEAEVISSQARKPELGRYWLQVDRQTKRSFDTPAEAEAAGLLIKSAFSQLQVSVYDKEDGANKILEIPV
ncbi:MAG: hypothetical protein RO009_17115 [Pseudorhodoplanes sp.]|jgi:hypothetical protein|nr:hypothetical protein [Pseudorhodoplanes sp.]